MTITLTQDPYSGSVDQVTLGFQDVRLRAGSSSFGTILNITDIQLTVAAIAIREASNAKLCSVSKKTGTKYLVNAAAGENDRLSNNYPEVETTAVLKFQSNDHCDVQLEVVIPAPLDEIFVNDAGNAGDHLLVDTNDSKVQTVIKSLVALDATGAALTGGQAILASPKYGGISDFFCIGGIRVENPRPNCVARL